MLKAPIGKGADRQTLLSKSVKVLSHPDFAVSVVFRLRCHSTDQHPHPKKVDPRPDCSSLYHILSAKKPEKAGIFKRSFFHSNFELGILHGVGGFKIPNISDLKICMISSQNDLSLSPKKLSTILHTWKTFAVQPFGLVGAGSVYGRAWFVLTTLAFSVKPSENPPPDTLEEQWEVLRCLRMPKLAGWLNESISSLNFFLVFVTVGCGLGYNTCGNCNVFSYLLPKYILASCTKLILTLTSIYIYSSLIGSRVNRRTNGWVCAFQQNSASPPPASKLPVDPLICPFHTFARKFPKFGLLPFLVLFHISPL